MIKLSNKRESNSRIAMDHNSHKDNRILEPITDDAKASNNSSQAHVNDRSISAKRLLSSPFTVSFEQLNQDIKEDYYDQ